MQDEQHSRWNAIGPIALAVLAYSGQLGASPLLAWLPVNVTILSAAVVVLAFVLSLVQAPRLSPLVLLPVGLWVAFLYPTVQHVSGDYAASKVMTLMSLGLLCVLAPFQLLRLRIQRTAFLVTFAVIALLASVVTVAQGDQAAIDAQLSEDVILFEGANTISTARIVGTGAIVLIAAAATLRRGKHNGRLWFLLVGLGLAILMVATGSRGPLAGILVAVAALIMVSPTMRGRRVRSLAFLALGGVSAYTLASARGFVTSDRAFAWLAGERDTSTGARQYLWDAAADHASLNPIGTGWGGFTTVQGIPSNSTYPHNLVLELYVEAGWVIASLAMVFIIASLWRLVHRSTSPAVAILFALAMFAMVNAMVSGDINDNRLLWMLLGAAWAIPSPDDQPDLAEIHVSRERGFPSLSVLNPRNGTQSKALQS